MLKLLSFPPAFGQPSASGFCVKAMCLLNMAGVKWEADFNADPREAPKRKLPVLETENGPVADSEFIRSYLEDTHGIDFDAGLTAEQRAQSMAIIRMVEEHLYFAIVCDRWLNDDNWEFIKNLFFSDIPAEMRDAVTAGIRDEARAKVDGQGIARHSVEDQFARANKDISAIGVLLGDKPFLFGDKPTAADASAGPMLGGIMGSPTPTLLSERVNNDPNLVAYVERCIATMVP
ncbi:MAG: glutathione S-transferase family protein [Rhodobacteraceae bacterium]|nr:glutathione S-transferase family protein [Paracoccaceae bacterium]